MPRIAHLSDVHLLDPASPRATARYRLATKLVSLGRAMDPRLRARKLTRALQAARVSGADHVVVSGDLTEVGEASEFEMFAQVLAEAELDPDRVTLVPGNHDAYTSAKGWSKALEGPLRPYAASSATHAGKVVDRGAVAFLPIDSTCFQSIARAGGEFTRDAARAVERRLADPALRGRTVVLVLHHSPFVQHKNAVMQWIDGLRGCSLMLELLRRHPGVQVLHGHLHQVVDRVVTPGRLARMARIAKDATARVPRVFGAPAVCDDSEVGHPRIRLYDVTAGALESVPLVA